MRHNNKSMYNYFLFLIFLYASLVFKQVLSQIEVERFEVKIDQSLISEMHVKTIIISSGNEAISISNLDEFDNFVKNNPLVFVMFYNSYSYFLESYLLDFDSVAEMLSHHDPPVSVVKVEYSSGIDIIKKYNIMGFPSFKFFMDGEPHPYTGSNYLRTTLLHWVDNKLKRDKVINSNSHLDILMKNLESHNIVIGAFGASADAADFIHVAREWGEDMFFGYLKEPTVIDYFIEHYVLARNNSDIKNLKPPFIIMFDQYEKNIVLYRESLNDRHAIEEFVKKYEFPTVVEFDNNWASKLFSDGRPVCVLLLDSNEEEKNRDYKEQFKKVANDYRGFILFTVSNNVEIYEKRLMSLLGAEEDVLPVVRIAALDRNSGGHFNRDKKYKPESLPNGIFNEQELRNFIVGFNRKILKPYLKSEAISDANVNEGPVKIVVGLTFDDVVRKSEQNVLITLHAPWCGHCRKLEPNYKELAIRLSEVKDLIIAKIDATRNEIKNLFYSGFPTIYLFPKGNKDSPILYQGNRSVEDMMNFINTYTKLNLDVDFLMSLDLKNKKLGSNNLLFEEL